MNLGLPPADFGTGMMLWLLGGAALLYATKQVWKIGIRPLAHGVRSLFMLPETAKAQVIEWAEDSPRVIRLEEWTKNADIRFDSMDTRLESIDGAVNHRGDGPTLSHESAQTAAMLARVADTVDRIAEHVGLNAAD